MSAKLNLDKVRNLRARAQLLNGSELPGQPEQVVQSVIGFQAQELPSAYLSIRARSQGITANQLQQVHQVEAAFAWTWCMRGTLHLITAQDARWMIPLLGPGAISGDRRRLARLGWTDNSARKGIEIILALLEEHGEITRSEIAAQFEKNGLPFQGQAPVHLIFKAACEGLITTAGFRGSKPAYTLFESRHGKLNPIPREQGLAELATRFLSAYGPARVQDFSAWSGLKMSEAKLAWQQISSQIVDGEVNGLTLQMLAGQLDKLFIKTIHPPVLRLLPRFDTYLLGYADRSWMIDPEFEGRLFPGGGIISAVIALDGLVVGVWKLIPGKQKKIIEAEIFRNQPTHLYSLIEKEAADIGRFLANQIDLRISRQA